MITWKLNYFRNCCVTVNACRRRRRRIQQTLPSSLYRIHTLLFLRLPTYYYTNTTEARYINFGGLNSLYFLCVTVMMILHIHDAVYPCTRN